MSPKPEPNCQKCGAPATRANLGPRSDPDQLSYLCETDFETYKNLSTTHAIDAMTWLRLHRKEY